MNICEVIKEGRKQNRAFRQSDWPEGLFAYHGMDNQVRFSDTDDVISSAIATMLSDNWELYDAPYHGRLAAKSGYKMAEEI